MYNLNDVFATKLFKNLEIEVVMKVFYINYMRINH